MGADNDDADNNASGSVQWWGRGSGKYRKIIYYNQPHLTMREEERLSLLATTATNNKDNDNVARADDDGQRTVVGGRVNVGPC